MMARRSNAASGIEVTIELGLMAIDLLPRSYEVYLVLTAPDGGHIRASWLSFRPSRIATERQATSRNLGKSQLRRATPVNNFKFR